MRSVGGAWIRTRQTASGPRYQVRYRHGSVKLKHGGSFKTKKEAEARRMFILMEQAAGRDPEQSLREMQLASKAKRPVTEWVELYRASRIDLSDSAKNRMRAAFAKFTDRYGERDPLTLTYLDVQEWVNGLTLSPTTVHNYLDDVRLLLDFAGCDPNPARDKRVKKPRRPRTVIRPPTASEVAAILSVVPDDVRLPLSVMVQTGMRGGEVLALEWQDVDFQRSRFRLRDGKTNAARRWVKVPDDLMGEVRTLAEGEGRATGRDGPPQVEPIGYGAGNNEGPGRAEDTLPLPSARVFPLHRNRLRTEMQKAREALGLDPSYSPHKLRHRNISVRVARGDPIAQIAEEVGHSRKSTTLDTYAWVLVEDE